MYSTTVCQFSNLLINITRNQPLNISTRVIIFFVIIITFLWTRGYSFCENHLSKCLYGCRLPIIDTWHLLQIVSFFYRCRAVSHWSALHCRDNIFGIECSTLFNLLNYADCSTCLQKCSSTFWLLMNGGECGEYILP